jgi:predicted AlkP superfamily pyrophosphatase or phosphodiesterase
MARLAVVAGVLAGFAVLQPPAAAQAPRAPKLAVVLVVDQMRADYVDRFQSDWTGGLKRLVTHGARFRRAAYPYLNTVTCPGHATIATGTFPRTHGIVQNAWWDAASRTQTTCTADDDAKTVSYGAAISGAGDSARHLAVPTFTDVMRTQRNARVVTLSLKARSAIMLAGHGAEAVTWLSAAGDQWVTSTPFAAAPVAAVKAFVDARPITADYGKTWTRLLPERRYQHADDAPGENPTSGWSRSFPHVIGTGSRADASFFAQWQRSPFADAYLVDLALAQVDAFKLGQRDTTDVLAISFSSTDLVGHAFGPDSHEVQDIYAHLDRSLGTLLERLDARVGRDQYVLALSADHGVTPIPEHLADQGHDAGRLSAVNLAALVDTRMQAVLGEGRYVSRVNGNDVYLEPGMYERLTADTSALKTVLESLKKTAGLAGVYTATQARSGGSARDPLLRAAALSYFPGRSGDLLLVPKPGWISGAIAATHGSGSPDDQRVPVIFFGPGVKPGTYDDEATPADVAPTLAALSGFMLQRVDGRPLKTAVRSK